MARSIFKRVMKIGSSEVRKSIAGLAMIHPYEIRDKVLMLCAALVIRAG